MSSKIQKNSIFLDTLAQLPTDSLNNLKKRARSKCFTQAVTGRLLYLNSPLHKYYQSAYYCAHILKQEGKKVTSHYCKTRVCHICNRISTAKLIKGYINQLMSLDGLQFVTLTIPNCNESELNVTVDSMLKSISNIVRVIRERKKIKINGIRKIEGTYNFIENTYHPHIHLLVDSNAGNLIVTEWLKRYPKAKLSAQNVRIADKNSLNELFKYTTKIISRTKVGVIDIYVPALDKIMLSLKGRRCFQPFGNIKKVDEDEINLESQEYDDIEEYDFIEWIWKDCDWVNGSKTLTGYIPPDIEINYFE